LFYPYAFLFTFLAVNLNNDVDSGSSMSDSKTTMINPKRKHDENLAEEESSHKVVRRSTSIEGVEEIPPPTSHISLPPISTSTSASSLSSNSSTPTGEELLSSLDPLFQCYNIYDMEAFYQLLSHHADSNLLLTLKYLSNYTIEGINPVFVFSNISHECYPDATLKILERRIVNLSTASSTPTTPLDRKSSVSSPEASVSVPASVAASKPVSSDGSNTSHTDKSKTVVNSGSSSATAAALSSTSSSSASNKIVRIEYICKFNGTIISNQDISVIYQQFLRHTEESLTSVLSAATTNATTTASSPAKAVVSPLADNTENKPASEESSPNIAPEKTNNKKKGRKKELKASDDTVKEESTSSSSRTQDHKEPQQYANGLKHINQMKLDDLSMNLARFISQNYLVMNMNDNPTRQSSSYIFELVLTFNPVTSKVLRCDMDILAKTDVSVAQTVLPSQISRKLSKITPTSSTLPEK
jgi:uncharacterized protein YfcZ (UPF0381/DUF406 family)